MGKLTEKLVAFVGRHWFPNGAEEDVSDGGAV